MSTEYIDEVNIYLKSIQDEPEYIDEVYIHIKNLEDKLESYLLAPRRKILEEELSHWTIKMRRELNLKSLGI
jgi:hypothetical protein